MVQIKISNTFIKLIFVFFCFLSVCLVYQSVNLRNKIEENITDLEHHINSVSAVPIVHESTENEKDKLKDWNDYKFMVKENLRVGPGEKGEGFQLTDPDEIELNQQLLDKTGFSVVVSDKISVERSLLNAVHPHCMDIKYLEKLPSVSVIIIFHNEVKSVLLRTIHSVINRTPAELLHEVILVNDNSTEPELYEPLQTYVNEHFGGKVKIKNLNERKGLIVTRMEGARAATGDILVFFDSHVEVQTNWLPPLIEPIAKNRKLGTTPIIDYLDPESFAYMDPGDFLGQFQQLSIQ